MVTWAVSRCSDPARDDCGSTDRLPRRRPAGWLGAVAALSPALTCARRGQYCIAMQSVSNSTAMAIPFTPMPTRFLSVTDLDPEAIAHLLDLADALKHGRSPAADSAPLAGRSVALIFQKPSLRTRVELRGGSRPAGRPAGRAHRQGGRAIASGSRSVTERKRVAMGVNGMAIAVELDTLCIAMKE